jgi:hypothetical protein
MRFFNKFQAKDYAWPFRALVFVGIWMHFAAISAVTFVRQQTGRRAQK